MTRVLISVPTGDGWIHKHVTHALLKLQADNRYERTITLPTHRPLENSLAHIQRDFLAGNYDFWVNIDDDNPPLKNPLDLIQLDLDIIGLPTLVWHNAKKGDRPIYYNAVKAVPGGFRPHEIYNGLQEVDAVGGGCMVVARRVLEKLKAPFQRTWNEDGTLHMGNDYAFCTRAKQAGFKVWAHFDYPCLHFQQLELTEVMNAFQDIID